MRIAVSRKQEKLLQEKGCTNPDASPLSDASGLDKFLTGYGSA
jgi:hypothetical protein